MGKTESASVLVVWGVCCLACVNRTEADIKTLHMAFLPVDVAQVRVTLEGLSHPPFPSDDPSNAQISLRLNSTLLSYSIQNRPAKWTKSPNWNIA